MIRRLVTLFALFVVVTPANAGPFPPTQVNAARDTSDLIGCGVQHNAASKAVLEALHANDVPRATASDIAEYAAVEAYVALKAQYIVNGCAIGIVFRFQSNQPVMVGKEFGIRRVDLILCERTGLLSGQDQQLQNRVNAWLRAVVKECVSELQRES